MGFFHQYDHHLSAKELALVERAREFCAGSFSEDVHAAYSQGEPFSVDWISKWAGLGMLGLQAKREHGGHEASFLCKIRVAQEMAQHSFAAAFCLNHHQSIVTRVSHSGSAEQRDRLLKEMISGSILGSVAMTEPAGGSDLAALSTVATPVEGGWLLNGRKSWVTDGTIVKCLVLLARVSGGEAKDEIASFLVPCDAQNAIERRELVVPGARSFRLAEIAFQNHFVPAWTMLNRPGEALKTSLVAVNAARVHVAAMCVASLFAALREAIKYCEGRLAFGKPVLVHQGLQWELAEIATRAEAANALVFKAAQRVNQGDVVQTLAAQCKKFAVDTAVWGIDQCIRVMGAVGASSVHRLSMLHAEVRMAAYGDGTNEVLLDRIGRGLIKQYGDACGSADEAMRCET